MNSILDPIPPQEDPNNPSPPPAEQAPLEAPQPDSFLMETTSPVHPVGEAPLDPLLEDSPAPGPLEPAAAAEGSGLHYAQAAKAATLSSEPLKPARKNLLERTFDPTTKFGRGMRAFTRGLGTVVGFFALGMMVTYILFFQPLEQGFKDLQAELDQSKAAVVQADERLAEAQLALSGAQAERSSALQLQDTAIIRLDVQRSIAKAHELRIARLKGDTAEIRTLSAELEALITTVSKDVSSDSAESLTQVMALIKKDITRPELAEQDLVRLISELKLIDLSLE